MKTFTSRIKHFVLTNKWWSALILVGTCVVVYTLFFRESGEILPETVKVERRTVTEEVSTTGTVKPIANINLSFERGGRIARIAVAIGSRVSAGQQLASLSNEDLAAAVDQAKAGLAIAEANLQLLLEGTRPEELTISQAAVTDAEKSLNDKMNEAYTKADDAIRNYADLLFDFPGGQPKIKIPINNSQLENDINAARSQVQTMLTTWGVQLTSINVSSVSAHLNTLKLFLDSVASAANAPYANSVLSESTAASYRANISTARANVNGAIANITAAETAYNSAKATYDLKLAGSTAGAVSAQRATVAQAQANVRSAEAQLEKSIIRSPISGIVTRVDVKLGETVSAGANAVSVISAGAYEIESYVAEVDITKIKVGDIATTTLDAYGNNVFFQTQVAKIDPAETVVSNVPTYKVTLAFLAQDERVKSGMTANLDILTAERRDVLSVPSRSVYAKDGSRYVRVPNATGGSDEVAVMIGIRGIEGYSEIISGLSEGDLVLASPNI